MSSTEKNQRDGSPHDDARTLEHEVPQYESWLGVCLLAFVPVVAAVFAPDTFMRPLIVSGFVILAVGLVMFIAQMRRDKHRASRQNADTGTSANASP